MWILYILEYIMSGLRTIAERIQALENTNPNLEKKPQNIIEKMIEDKKKDEEAKRKNQYEIVCRNYKETIEKLIGPDVRQNIEEYITLIIDITVLFVEEFSPLVFSLFDLLLSGYNKEQLAIELIKQILTIDDKIVFVKNTISFLVKKNKLNKTEQLYDKAEKKVKRNKKSFFSMRIK